MIALDAQLTIGTSTGIGEYITGLLAALAEIGASVQALHEARLDPWRFDRRILWDQVLLPLRARDATLLHCAAGTVPLLLRQPYVVTVHDVAWLRVQQHVKRYAREYFGPMMLARYRRARRLLVDSEFSRNELLDLGGFDAQRVDVITPGVAADFARVERRVEENDEPPCILVVGTVERRKNLALIIEALARMRNRRAWILACGPPTPYLDECKAAVARLGLHARVRFRGYVSRAELLGAYSTAAAAAVPSRYEGFGYAAAQALVGGVPLLAARGSSLTEVCAADAPLLDPDDVQGWADALDLLCDDPAAANALAAQKRQRSQQRFAWTTSARQMQSVYNACLVE